MFTGIIEEIGSVLLIKRNKISCELHIACALITQDLKIGDSIAVNGACLTVTQFDNKHFVADAVAETMHRTTLSELIVGSKVNLERALTLNSRLGGHLVSGHVDTKGMIKNITNQENAVWFTVELHPEYARYIVAKGSVALNGVSLTVVEVQNYWFSVSVIPHSLHHTTLKYLKTGDHVNIECDLTAKYIEKFMMNYDTKQQRISADFLKENGFY